jgi:uncharacterized protein YeaO (DUF488 family)
MLASRRDATSEPGGFTAISRWSSAAIPPDHRAETAAPEHSHAIKLLATLSRQSNFSVGCYGENEAHCHRSILRALLAEEGAMVAVPE